MPALIPLHLQVAHDLPSNYYIVRVVTNQHRTASGKSWAKPFYIRKEVISNKSYFNYVFVAFTHKLVRAEANYTCAGYIVDNTCFATDSVRVETNYYFYQNKEAAIKEGAYIGEIGTIIDDGDYSQKGERIW